MTIYHTPVYHTVLDPDLLDPDGKFTSVKVNDKKKHTTNKFDKRTNLERSLTDLQRSMEKTYY